MQIQNLKIKILSWIKDQKILSISFVVLALMLVGKSLWKKQEAPPQTIQEQLQVDTLIPVGFVLVPIQIQNFESASALLGPAGIVDLWTINATTGRQSKKIASRLKIIRAPLNPQMYAVLVPENDSAKILEHGDSFLVTVQSEHSDSPEVLQDKKQVLHQIETFETKE